MEKCLIVAVADNMAIGRGGDMPWHISEDLKYFKRTTLGCPVIMGRKTWESIGSRALPGRKNIVVSRNPDAQFPGAEKASSLIEAFSLCEGAEKLFVLGGAKVYQEAISLVDKMYITHVHCNISDADTYFPEINTDIWAIESRSALLNDSETGMDFEFVVYKRRNG